MLLGVGAFGAAVAGGLGEASAKAFVGPIERHIALHNLHTGEHLSLTYFDKGRYLHPALHAVNHFLRDFRTGQAHAISPQLLDLLNALSAKLEMSQPFHVISGYRSPKTNARMHKHSHAVATHSFHMKGQAIDIRAPGVELADLHKAARELGRGGVGFYPESDFVHVDVGPVRHWAQEPGLTGEG